MSKLRHSIFLFGAFAIAACATSGTADEGTGTVGGGGRIDSGGGETGPYGGSDDASTGTDVGMMTMSDSGVILADSSPTDTGTAADTGPTGHIECPATLAYAMEAAVAPSSATACTMGGPECVINVECCFADVCVQYPAP